MGKTIDNMSDDMKIRAPIAIMIISSFIVLLLQYSIK